MLLIYFGLRACYMVSVGSGFKRRSDHEQDGRVLAV